MKSWIRFGAFAWLAACGSGPAPPGPAPPPAVSPVPVRLPALAPTPVTAACARPGVGTVTEHALLRVGCGSRLEPGRATWTVAGDAVVLRFPPDAPGPRGRELVAAWPPRDRPPWLGHRVNRITILADGGIRVEFGDPVRDPARLFADPRLAGVPLPVAEGDARDAIDANAGRVVTRHDASIEYARSLGRSVEPVGFDRLYLVAFAGSADGAAARAMRDEVGIAWIGSGAALARRLPSVRWEPVAAMCASAPMGAAGEADAAAEAAEPGEPSLPTVSYPEDDPAARQIAERIVSLGLPGGPFATTVSELAGSGERMAVRPVASGGERRGRADVAAVASVYAGSAHPCSLHAEVAGALDERRAAGGRGFPTVLLVGEAASFAIEPAPAPPRPLR